MTGRWQGDEAPDRAAASPRSSAMTREQAPAGGGLDGAYDPAPKNRADSTDANSDAAECDGRDWSDVPSGRPVTNPLYNRQHDDDTDELGAERRATIEMLRREIEEIDKLLGRGRNPRQ